ncbi:YebC/PmpR family DNA-binding transcriptional regulator [Salimicrobium halophilum]|uniref:Probable transcriptional regulatory protein SAMN04490247_0052 n=1 Tax=Salimicrobium halophilum TaxID=86666 RepID=A0A1G8PKZ9_9BACI|nr:YebC/PmpR family DNA-binding transcriptional regulator [Salimicrobium halophilum]SDI93016.1 DNA-binding regulatory protein, YebC/PmpR family [Salimicrobium halophilum]
MAGHSKWSNIKHRKGAQDAKRGKLFQKLARQIFVAAKQGDPDPEMNPDLRLAIEKARSNNMPKDNIDRAVKKATGDLEGESYEEIVYEGYGPGGVAVMVNVLTDNKNRTAPEVRHAFSKHGGNLGENGCVSFMFDRKGFITIDRSQTEVEEDDIMLEAIEAGADELETTDDFFEIYTEPENFQDVKKALGEYPLQTAEVTMIPQTYTPLDEEGVEKMLKLIDMLEDNDDVQDIYHNLDADQEVLEKLS